MNIQLKYDIVFRTPFGEVNSDIQFLTFVRAPLVKLSSFAILKINLSPTLIQQMINDLTNNIFVDYSLEIYTVDEARDDIPVEKLFNKTFKVVNVESTEPIIFDKQSISCYLVLVNPFIHYMSTTNTFNVILENITAFDAIKEFEKFIKDQYGNIFNFNSIASSYGLNKFKYEQILVKTNSDLSVPVHLINTYKPFDSFNFYFFDDFYLDEDNESEITCHHINLFDKDRLRKIDVTQFIDVMGTTKKLDVHPLSDQKLSLDKLDQTFTVLNREMLYSTTKQTQSKIPKRGSAAESKTATITDNRIIKVGNFVAPSQIQTIDKSSQHANIYSPDSVDNAINRFEIFRDFFMKHIEHIQTFESTECLPDWCKFGHLYNMGNLEETEYQYTPLCIFNMFVRINIKETYCQHMSRYSMLKYLDEDAEYSYFNVLKESGV
jgi:hypothetical protein